MSQTTSRRRSSRRRVNLDTTTVLALALPLVTLAALFLVRPGELAADNHPPARTSLSNATIVCPSALPGAPAAYLSTAAKGAHGKVTVRADKAESSADLAEGEVTRLRAGTGPIVVDGEGGLAPGLVGARFGGAELAATSCPTTTPDRWFTGVGAAAQHSSTLELVNPDAGPAVADVTVFAGSGPVAGSLRSTS